MQSHDFLFRTFLKYEKVVFGWRFPPSSSVSKRLELLGGPDRSMASSCPALVLDRRLPKGYPSSLRPPPLDGGNHRGQPRTSSPAIVHKSALSATPHSFLYCQSRECVSLCTILRSSWSYTQGKRAQVQQSQCKKGKYLSVKIILWMVFWTTNYRPAGGGLIHHHTSISRKKL